MVSRGAGGAPGRTSWQSKPEQDDYISFIGLMVYYLHHLQPVQIRAPEDIEDENELHGLSPIPSQVVPVTKFDAEDSIPPSPQRNPAAQPLLLLSGYSYGALITTALPPMLASIISQFQTPVVGSPHAEIRLRANFLADQQTELMNDRFSSLASDDVPDEDGAPTSPRVRGANTSGGVRMGGHEDLRKSSHESHRSRTSLSRDPHVRRSMERVRLMAKPSYFAHQRHISAGSITTSGAPMQGTKGPERSGCSSEVTAAEARGSIGAIQNMGQDMRVAYLLVSPLHGWINSLATMSLFGSKSRARKPVGHPCNSLPEPEAKFTIDPTLALFGDNDVFVSVNKLRAWGERIHSACERRGNPNFVHKEVPGAGHFWHDHEALQILREEIKDFVSSL